MLLGILEAACVNIEGTVMGVAAARLVSFSGILSLTPASLCVAIKLSLLASLGSYPEIISYCVFWFIYLSSYITI